MLHRFLTDNREEILLRARTQVAARSAPKPTELHPRDGLPLFLDLLGAALLPAGGGGVQDSISTHRTAALGSGLTVQQAIHDYGDLCRVVTELAIAGNVPIDVEELVTLDLCFDAAVACAVTECEKA